ncbi:MAG: SUMF1/EgtB/PvdO family nonheme iron enzyme, partial [Bacteroidia bacterium]|nr:SUMF1/EgtB/PvdO family nonheme iron enzyme [Bacteroidia bacterium]
MRNKNAIVLFLFGSVLLLLSCKVIKNIKQSRQTIEDEFVLIPAGAIDMVDRPQDSQVFEYELNLHRDPGVKADSFYMCKFEITNAQYREFLWVISRQKDTAMPYHQFSKSGDTAYYRNMKLDSAVWVRPQNFRKEAMYYYYLQAFPEYYFAHPFYSDYPVVGITHEQAVAYCEFKTEMYNNYYKRKYKKVIFRLPTKMEWEFAA